MMARGVHTGMMPTQCRPQTWRKRRRAGSGIDRPARPPYTFIMQTTTTPKGWSTPLPTRLLPPAPCTHEEYIAAVRAHAVRRVVDPESKARLDAAKMVYGTGSGSYRGVTYYCAWRNGQAHDWVEIAATGEENPIQLAGTTIHELGHVLAGNGVGHGPEWKAAARTLGLVEPMAQGQNYTPESFDPDMRDAVLGMRRPTDGAPAFGINAYVTGLGMPTLGTIPVCKAGRGRRGGRSQGPGSGSRLRLWVCACEPVVKARVASDDFRATCGRCGAEFKRGE